MSLDGQLGLPGISYATPGDFGLVVYEDLYDIVVLIGDELFSVSITNDCEKWVYEC